MRALFVTSGFPNGFPAGFLEQLQRFLPRTESFVMVASDFSAHEKSERYLAGYLREFSQKGIAFSQGRLVDFSIEPHFADAEKNRMADVLAAAECAMRPFYGLYDESFIVEAQGTRTFFGPYRQLHP